MAKFGYAHKSGKKVDLGVEVVTERISDDDLEEIRAESLQRPTGGSSQGPPRPPLAR